MGLINITVPDETDEERLSKCTCGATVKMFDDAMCLMVTCKNCGKSTEENLFGASSYLAVYDQTIKEWNELVKI